MRPTSARPIGRRVTLIRFSKFSRRPSVRTALLAGMVATSSIGMGASVAAEPSGASAALDEVLVTGERPGPGLWRVSQGSHDLWILATLEPLPKKMTWRSQAVEARIAASQSVLAPPQVEPRIGFFRGLTLLPSVMRARNSPDGETLEQALPHELYMRWLALRVKYLGGSDEHLRPMLAAFDLYTHALDQSDLSMDDSVWTVVQQTAHKHRVPIVPVVLELPIEDPKGAIRELGHIPPAAEVECLESTVKRLETDLQPMRQRANLWSLGDVEGLRAARYPDDRIACLDALNSVPKLRDQVTEAKTKLTGAWLAAAVAALDKNESTFAVLPIGTLLKTPGGWLDLLRAQGYAVQEPR